LLEKKNVQFMTKSV